MAKKATKRRPLAALFTWLATLLAGAGVGGWAWPDLPVVGQVVQSGLQWARANGVPAASAPQPGAPPVTRGTTTRMVTAAPTPAMRAGQTILIGTYNIQVFGSSKIAKPEVMQCLVHVVRQLDLVAIQEVRSQDDSIIPTFVNMINADGHRYHYVIGPRLGRTSSKEQYVFVYNTDRIEIDPNSVLTMDDRQDLLHREPLLARFRARTMDPNRGFTFWLMNVHTDPDEVKTEVDALADAFVSVQQRGWGEDDVILLGDLNASEKQLGRLGQLPGIRPAIVQMATNTRGDKTYDNIVMDSRATVEYTGQAGVLNLMQTFNITLDQALQVSDHLPVWAVFSCYENVSGEALVAQQGGTQR